MQDALRSRHMGKVIRAFRCHPFHGRRPLAQTEVAGWAAMTQPQLSRAECGPAINDLGRLVLWARLLQIPPRYLWFAMPEDEHFAERRSSSPALSAGRLTVEAESVRRGLTHLLADGAPAEAAIEDWEVLVLRYGRATRDRPAGELAADLFADLVELERALSTARTLRALRRLTRATAQLSGLMLLAFVKLDQRTAWRRWAQTARVAAIEADDPATLSWVIAQEAYGHFYNGDLSQAIGTAREAEDVAGGADRASVPLAASVRARAHAVTGDHRQAAEALDRAEHTLGRLSPDALESSAFGYNEAQLRFHEGNAWTHLGLIDPAWRAQERALELCAPDDYTDWAMIRLDRVVCLAARGEVVEAMRYGTETLTGLHDRQRDQIILGRAGTIVGALPTPLPVRAQAAVDDFCDLVTESGDHHTGGES